VPVFDWQHFNTSVDFFVLVYSVMYARVYE